MFRINSWTVYKGAYIENKEHHTLLILHLINNQTEEDVEIALQFTQDDIRGVDEMINNQLIPCLKGKKISGGEFLVENLKAKPPTDVSVI